MYQPPYAAKIRSPGNPDSLPSLFKFLKAVKPAFGVVPHKAEIHR